jgi:predicted lipid carrier protein YhbT
VCHEPAAHRYDAQASRGLCAPIPAELAAGGIDEVLDEVLDVLVLVRGRTGHGTGRVMDLRSADLGIEWVITLGPERIGVARRSKDDPAFDGNDIIVTGTASDLALTLYRRPSRDCLDVHGDYSVLGE